MKNLISIYFDTSKIDFIEKENFLKQNLSKNSEYYNQFKNEKILTVNRDLSENEKIIMFPKFITITSQNKNVKRLKNIFSENLENDNIENSEHRS